MPHAQVRHASCSLWTDMSSLAAPAAFAKSLSALTVCTVLKTLLLGELSMAS